MGLGSLSTMRPEVGRGIGNSACCLQPYLLEERTHSEKLVKQAKKVGYKVVMLMADMLMQGCRNMEVRNQFKRLRYMQVANFVDEELGLSKDDAYEEMTEASRETSGNGSSRR